MSDVYEKPQCREHGLTFESMTDFTDHMRTHYAMSEAFHCCICRVETDLAPNPPMKAVCYEDCPDHNYVYIKGERGHFCENCGKPAPADWFDID